jgi:hypothetical protein
MEKELSVGKMRILGASRHAVGEVLHIKDTTFKLFKVLPSVRWEKYCACSMKHLDHDTN